MSVNWEISVSAINVETGRGDLLAVRTDSESTAEPWSFSFQNTPLATPQDRELIWVTLKGWVQQRELHNSSVDEFMANFVQETKAEMLRWETARLAGGE